MDTMAERWGFLRTELKESGLDLDEKTSRGMIDQDGRAHVVVSLKTVQETEEMRALVRASTHVLSVELFRTNNIRVEVPFSTEYLTSNFPVGLPSSEWIVGTSSCVKKVIYQSACTLASMAFERVVTAYPWREAEKMQRIIPSLIHQVAEVVATGTPHPIFQGNVDAILPPFPFSEAEKELLVSIVHTYLGFFPDTFFHLYESVYLIKRQLFPKPCDPLMERVFHYFFRV